MKNNDTKNEAPVRLNKALAQAGICSRRNADELIFAGKVRVNGQVVVEPGVRVIPGKDRIEVEGQKIGLSGSGRHEYVMLHKPVEVVSTMRDPQRRTTVIDILPKELCRRRVVPVGRLDYFSEGLLLLTSDGDLTYRLTHPKHHLPKVYEVLVRGKIGESSLGTMRKGMKLTGGQKLAPVKVEILKRLEGGRTLLRMVLIQGINRQIRRMCDDLDLVVLRLKRVAVGRLALGDLPKGAARRLTKKEVEILKADAGLS